VRVVHVGVHDGHALPGAQGQPTAHDRQHGERGDQRGQYVVAAVTRTAVPVARALGLSARDVLQSVLPLVGGRGGGKDDVAQGGGSDPSGIDAALAAVVATVRAVVDRG